MRVIACVLLGFLLAGCGAESVSSAQEGIPTLYPQATIPATYPECPLRWYVGTICQTPPPVIPTPPVLL